MIARHALMAISCAVSLIAPLHAGFSRYTITDLGTLGGFGSDARAINQSGQIAGWSRITGDSTYRGFLYSGGTLTALGTLGGQHSFAYGINDRGHIVGTSVVAGTSNTQAFLFDGTTMRNLGTFGGPTSVAIGINNRGTVVGNASSATGATRAFLYQDGKMIDLGTFGGLDGTASAINNAGRVAGHAKNADGKYRAYLYEGNGLIDLGTLGGESSFATAINNAGAIVGFSETLQDNRAFVYRHGVMSDLGILGFQEPVRRTYANDINDSGDVVGMVDLAFLTNRAAIWSGGMAADLNTLIPSGSGWLLVEARAINNRGQIVGYGLYQGQYPRAFLLTPTSSSSPLSASSLSPVSAPAPPGLLLALAGVVCLAGWRWQLARRDDVPTSRVQR